MKKSEIEELFGQDESSGRTIFHELVDDAAFAALLRLRNKNKGQWIDLLKVKDNRGFTCIHSAARIRSQTVSANNVIEILLQLGADLNAVDEQAGETVLHHAIHYDDVELSIWLCCQSQINLNAKNNSGKTAYQIAFEKKNEKLMKLLRKAGADCEEPQMSDSK